MENTNETLNLNGAEITRMLRTGHDFSNCTIIQTRGSTKTTEKTRARLIEAGAKDFILFLDVDARNATISTNYEETETYSKVDEFQDFQAYAGLE